MADIKRTTEGLEHCLARYDDGLCDDCPYMGEIDRSYMIPMKCKEIIMRDALELLNEQPKWIPINERKPNSCGTYVVARWFIDGCRRKILTDACYFDGSNTWHDDTRVNHSRPYLTDKIVAWMPLPNPPEDGEQE